MSVRFDILGPLRITGEDGRRIEIRQSRQRGLAAVLLLHPSQSLSPARLLGLLWDDYPPTTGALRTHVWALRKLLAPADRLLRDNAGYRLEVRPGELDLDAFRLLAARGLRALHERDPRTAADRLGRALALWREPAFEDVPATAGLSPVMRRMLDERQVAYEGLIDAKIGLGQHRNLVPELQAAVAEHPARERFGEQLMLVLYRIGRRIDALHVYGRIRSTLAAEYGMDPGPALQRLHQRILLDDPGLSLLT
jgi:DNA-binding SARP family transcriptional activator